jgi:hypothetical protein
MELDVLAEAIDRLVAADPGDFGDGESIVELHQQLSRLDGFLTMATARFDGSGDWALDGARTAAAWISTKCRITKSQARRQVYRGRGLRHLPAVTEAWLEGSISAPHVDGIVRVRREATEAALERDEALLVDYAQTLAFDSFERALTYWEQLADPVGVEDSDEKRRGRRDVYLAESFEGMWLGKITLDPISGAIVSSELRDLEKTLFQADWSEARDRLGREPRIEDLARTSGQRRADALVEMATRSRTAPADGRRPAPLFSVFVGYETLQGRILQLAQGAAVSPGALIPWLEHADIERAVFGPSPRVEISITSRLFSGATRRGVELRDRQCTHPYCDDPEADCDIDHIVPYTEGGPTSQENGRVLCGFHNRLRNGRPPPDE